MLNLVDLTELEQSLVAHVVRGEVLDLAPGLTMAEIGIATMRRWGDDHNIRASVIRDILRGRHLPAEGADPHGLRLRGATIVGRLDLDDLTTLAPLSLVSSNLPDGLSGNNCKIPGLDLGGSVVSAAAEHSDDGAVRLSGATITAQLVLTGAVLTNESGPALVGDGINVGDSAFLDGGFSATGSGEHGAVRLLGATIQGQLVLRGAELNCASGPALMGDGMNVGNSAFLDDGFSASGAGEDGSVRLSGATIAGVLSLSGAVLTNESGPALSGDGMSVGSHADLDDRFTATGSGGRGAVRLSGATIQGQLVLSSAVLTNKSGPALLCPRMRVGSDAVLDDGFSATGAHEYGAVWFLGATIQGQLLMSSAVLTNGSGPALIGDGISVGSSAMLNGGFSAAGAGEHGAVRLSGANIAGQLDLSGAVLTNESGPALSAGGMAVGSDAFFGAGFSATGAGDDGAVQLSGAKITGQLQVSSVAVGGAIVGGGWQVDGLIYDGYPACGFSEWLRLLSEGTISYTPQPYQQLAAVARAAGHDADARRALMAQRDDQRKRGGLSWREKVWAGFTKFTLGYGYQPWRALLLVGGTLVVAAVVTLFVPGALAVESTELRQDHVGGIHTVFLSEPCTTVQKFQIAVDMAIPLVSTSQDSPCAITSTDAGQFVSALGVMFTFMGWALTALFAAGFTRAIRQP